MQYAFKPFAKYMGTKSSALRERFCEQAWFSIYYSTFFSIGLYLAYHSPYWLRTEYFWVDYPHMHYTGLFKSYYLLQLSFSLAQIVVLHLEKPRKDYVQFLVHHLLTIGLVSLSYYMNFTRIGNAIFITMDFADIFLSTAKCLKYIKFQKSCDAMFVLFVVAWIFSRHFVYIGIVQSIYTDVIAVRPLIWKPEEGMYMSYTTACVFVALFAGLKILILYWGWLIMKVVVKVVTGKGAEDNRSDGEESDDENVEIKDSVSTNSENQTANKSQCSPNSHLKQKEE
ncbi:TLC domain-containing protein [Paraphysoderma sedebokerense]|nr:TLC domain-containing protein [Paraphysoderma sedebokerense]